jgi:hypothetical protein
MNKQGTAISDRWAKACQVRVNLRNRKLIRLLMTTVPNSIIPKRFSVLAGAKGTDLW